MTLPTHSITSFGDARRMLLETIQAVRDGDLDASKGATIAALMKEVNSNIQVEINQAKMVLAADKEGHSFGRMTGMGQKVIANAKDQIA